MQEYYKKIADQADTLSQYNLSVMYYEGSGVLQNTAEAIKWWKKAAAQGHKDAQHNLRAIYIDSKLKVGFDSVMDKLKHTFE